MQKTKEFLAFLDNARSSFHAVDLLRKDLEAAGYSRLWEGEAWTLAPGGKYFMIRNGSSLVAFRIPEKLSGGFMIGAAHSDRPTFKMKENPEHR